MIKFSVITVVFNGESEIEKTICSIINQSYLNIEYIIIDGKSKDNTIKICNYYRNKINRIISESDLGLYDAMNKGIELASGDYIVFMNCGDLFSSVNTLDNLSKKILERPNDFRPDFIYGDSIEESFIGEKQFYKKARSSKYYWYGMFAHHQSMIYKVETIKSYKLSYDLEFPIAADYKFTIDFLSKSKNELYINEAICIFKQGGLSNNWKKGLKEQNKIRKSVLNYSDLKIILISFNLVLMQFLKRCLGPLYNMIRFTK